MLFISCPCQGTVGGITVKNALSKETKSTGQLIRAPVCKVNLPPRFFGKTKTRKNGVSIGENTTTRIKNVFFSSERKSGLMRQCVECLKTRDFIAFYKNPYKKDGYELRCKVCYKKAVRKVATTTKRTEKTCSNCKVIKPVAEFYKASASRDGFGAYCRPCVRDRNKAYRRTNPKARMRDNLSNKLYRENEDPEKRRQRKREYYAKHRERILRQRKEKEIREAMQKVFENA